MMNMEVRCPACNEWSYPQLPRAGNAARPETMGQARLNELVNANDEVDGWHNRRRKRRQPQHLPQPQTQTARPPQPAQEQWHIMTTDGPRGPFGNDKIIQLAREGILKPRNRMTNARTGNEIRAEEIPNLVKAKPKPASKTQWYVQTSKGDAGPFASAKIVEFAKDGKIKAKTMLRCGSVGEFIPAGTVNGLIPASA
jgi:hypothetical protein